MIIVIGMLSFSCVCFAILALVAETPGLRDTSAWIGPQSSRPAPKPFHKELAKSLYERAMVPLAGRIAALVTAIAPQGVLTETERRLERAGWPWRLTPQLFLALKVALLASALPAGFAAFRLLPVPLLPRYGAVLCIVGAAAVGPGLVIDRIAARRREAIRASLADVIDLLVVSVEAGMGLDAAVQEVIRREQGPLMEELRVVLGEIRLGKRRRDAWRCMAERVDLTELSIFVSALCQADQIGASIAGVLRTQSETMRVRRSLALREAAAKIPVKMLFPLVFFIFPAMFVVMLGPGVIKMIHTFKAIGF